MLWTAAGAMPACGGGAAVQSRCTSTSECPAGRVCIDGVCVASDAGFEAGDGVEADLPEAGGPDGDAAAEADEPETPDFAEAGEGGVDAADGGTEVDGEEACALWCRGACCEPGQICAAGVVCAEDLGPCLSHDDCTGDAYCDAATGRCVEYEVPPWMGADPTCRRIIPAGIFSPAVQCEFREAPAGDAWPANLHVLSAPMVADFLRGGDSGNPQPWIVAVFDDGVDGGSEQPTGVIRVLDGATCAQVAELGSLQLVAHSSCPAVGDLDGDGYPEIAAFKAGGGLVAFDHDPVEGTWSVLWRSTDAAGSPYEPTGGGWACPSIYDLDDDAVPEVLRGGIVVDAAGRLVDGHLGTFSYSAGVFAVVADVDDDAIAELVQGHGVWQWDASARQWVDEAWSPAAATAGHVAIADFGDYPGTHGWPADAPEVVVVRSGTVRVQTLDGEVQVGPIAIPGGGNGGPPTIADFDGDGRPEFATAAAHSYTVYDLDCSPSPVGTCASGGTDCVLWSQPNQDLSSNVTGSSVFDFEGDGRAEVVYGDECFARVYDGPSGAVLFSQYRSSCTWYENPVIADVDGDYNAEIVVGHNYNCGSADSGIACGGLGPRNTDPIFPGVRCASGDDCVSGTCDEGLCRCAGDAECCTGAGCERAGLVCETPPAGTPGTGNTCRAGRPRGALGITVYGDRADRWVRSRSIWNQHPYHVTNVREDATIPATSEVEANWKTPGLNNFRQNVQGDVHPGAAPDLTGRWSTTIVCWGSPPAVTLEVAVCNRGAEPVAADVPVGFYEGDPDAGGTRLCLVRTAERLAPRRCTTVYCEWAAPPAAAPGTDVHVVVDDGGEVGECREGNNRFVFEDVFCPGP